MIQQKNILESHLVVKGGTDDLTNELKEKLLGYKSSNIGFEGLINLEDKKYLDDNLLFEKPSIDDIIVFYINAARKN